MWGNNLWGPHFNVTLEVFLASSITDKGTNTSSNSDLALQHGGETSVSPSSVTFLGNGSGVALVTYVPAEAGASFVYGEMDNRLYKLVHAI